MKKDKVQNFKNLNSLQAGVNVLNEARAALGDKERTIKDSSMPEILGGILGAGVGGVGSFAALYGLGTVGLSAVGISTGLATAGGVVGGGMAAGVLVLAAPITIIAGTGVATAVILKKKQLFQEKQRLNIEALKLLPLLETELKATESENKERTDYLSSLIILIKRFVQDLESDLNVNKEIKGPFGKK